MRKISTFLLIGFLIYPLGTKANTEIMLTNKTQNLELAFLRFLGPTILTIMSGNGDKQLFTDERIEKITRNIEQDYYLKNFTNNPKMYTF